MLNTRMCVCVFSGCAELLHLLTACSVTHSTSQPKPLKHSRQYPRLRRWQKRSGLDKQQTVRISIYTNHP
uniref:Putative secreted protein n=1 Tax=Anopheles darlingi TaxID=43151 RepID=A0A2M4DC27_ANODA